MTLKTCQKSGGKLRYRRRSNNSVLFEGCKNPVFRIAAETKPEENIHLCLDFKNIWAITHAATVSGLAMPLFVHSDILLAVCSSQPPICIA